LQKYLVARPNLCAPRLREAVNKIKNLQKLNPQSIRNF